MQLGSSVVKRDPGYIFVIAVKFILLGNQMFIHLVVYDLNRGTDRKGGDQLQRKLGAASAVGRSI